MNFKTFKNNLELKTLTIDNGHYFIKNDVYTVLDFKLKTSDNFSIKTLLMCFLEPQTKSENWYKELENKVDDLPLNAITEIASSINEVINYHSGATNKKSPSE